MNSQKLEAEGKFYPAPAYIAEIGVNQLAEEISQSTTLTPLVTANDIEGIKVMYTPDAMLKAKLEKPEYVKLDAKYIADDEENTSNGN